MSNRSGGDHTSSLQVGFQLPSSSLPENMEEEAWIGVIRQMETIYTDILHYQVELEEKNAELENAQRFIKSVMSSMSDILVVCDVNGRIQETNLALEYTLNKTQEELVGTPIASLFTQDYAELVGGFPERLNLFSPLGCVVQLLSRCFKKQST